MVGIKELDLLSHYSTLCCIGQHTRPSEHGQWQCYNHPMNPSLQTVTQHIAKVMEAVPTLRFWGDPVLTTKATFSSFENAFKVCQDLEKALTTIRSIMGMGRGLAAPQIGVLERCFIVFIDEEFKYFINPSIESSSPETNWYKEMCLSCTPVSVDVERPKSIKVSYMDKEGNHRQETLDDKMSRVFQHEFDHLEGILNVDRADSKDISFMMQDPKSEVIRDTK